jgi:hypothetical protein
VRYENEKLRVGRNWNKSNGANFTPLRTSQKLANEYNVSQKTIKNDSNFSKGVDTISKAKPESRNLPRINRNISTLTT